MRIFDHTITITGPLYTSSAKYDRAVIWGKLFIWTNGRFKTSVEESLFGHCCFDKCLPQSFASIIILSVKKITNATYTTHLYHNMNFRFMLRKRWTENFSYLTKYNNMLVLFSPEIVMRYASTPPLSLSYKTELICLL